MTREKLKSCAAVTCLLLCASAGVNAATTGLANAPLVTSSASSVLPNILYVLDDSGSMGWDFLPDWACAPQSATDSSCSSTGEDPSSARNEYWFRSADYNGVYYNPAITYTPPAYFNSDGTSNTTTYPSMTAANTSNWTSVKNDAYGTVMGGTSNLVGNAYFYTIIPGEYCTSASLKSCNTQSAPSGTYTVPARLRWCNSSGLTTCQSQFNSGSGFGFTYARAPAPMMATITLSGSNSTKATSVTVNGVQILSTSTGSTTSTSALASAIASAINACSFGSSGSCGTIGYRATSSGSTVTIWAPGVVTTSPSVSPVVMLSGTVPMTATATAFAQGSVPGYNLLTVITSSVTSYPFPGTSDKASSRSDCAGTTCTYDEEMTNFANWWAYYRTRMQTMKTAASLAFATVNGNFRIGYLSINDNTGLDFLNIDTFSGAQKYNWYRKFFAADPGNSTPLRVTLAKAGRIYAGKYDGQTLNGSTVADPIQYSCQQNFTILSTDGYWNESSNPKQVDGTTDIGSQDSSEARPMNDGGSTVVTASTPTTTVVRKQTITSNETTDIWSQTVWSSLSACSGGKSKYTKQVQQRTETLDTTTTSIDDYTTTQTEVAVTTNGVLSSDTTTTTNSVSNVSSNTVTNNDTFTAWTNSGSATTTKCISTPSPNPSNSSLVSTSTVVTAGPSVTTLSTTGPTVGTTTTTTTVSGGSSNTLADVADYYYKTDLRTTGLGNCTGTPVAPSTTGNTLCSSASPDPYNNVPTSGLDAASWQHMTTFTLGLGASGYMEYSPSYATDNSGDFYNVKQGTSANPSSGICTWQSSGACNWPVPVSNRQTTIDDLWHAAVDGRGTYFSASNPAAINSGLVNALTGVSARLGSSAAATTSTPNVTTTDNYVFDSTFTSLEWSGELYRRQIDVTTGQVSNTLDWSAQAQLDAMPYTNRTIYTYSPGASNHLMPLAWGTLSGTQQAYFSLPTIATLSQFCASGTTCLSSSAQTAASGSPLLSFILGDRSNEEGTVTDNTKYFRHRTHVLGDIVDSEAAYVAKPRFNYGDYGYAAFITANQTRQPMVYVGANDGMLHAFYATTNGSNAGGSEAWAYVPSFVLPNLYKLADKNYKNQHQYFVDGTPVSADICVSNCTAPTGGGSTPAAVWKTILVGGLNGGGRGFYAMDVTDPASPSVLWEFSDADMGYSFGDPRIGKLADGTWVVLLTSGYNNVSPGDGQGRLYVLNAYTGALIRSIATGVGSATSTVTGCSAAPCPSGLAKIAAQVANTSTDSTILAVYGGDLYGNLWRFDVNNNIGASGYDAQLLATLRGPSPANNIQPITAKPDIGIVNGYVMVMVGTGELLGTGDLSDTSQQSFYGIKDIQVADPSGTGTPGSPSYGNPRTYGHFVQQTLTTTTCPAGSDPSVCLSGQIVITGSSNPVNIGSDNGWYIDLPGSGERVNTDPILSLGTILFNTNIPSTSACELGGSSFQYFLNFATGGPVNTQVNGVVSVKLDNSLVTRPVVVQLPNGNLVSLTVTGNGQVLSNNVQYGGSSGSARRVTWRELTTDQ